ncbi:MAG: hypothetical protein IJX33_07175 [Akkermansia sp.]|nr:hypothetical protein [Akkermansia sp.]
MDKPYMVVCADAPEEQELPLNEPDVQVWLFRELLELERELRGGMCMSITRSGDAAMCCRVYACGESKARFSHRVRLRELRCARQLMDEVTRIYSALAEAKLVVARLRETGEPGLATPRRFAAEASANRKEVADV